MRNMININLIFENGTLITVQYIGTFFLFRMDLYILRVQTNLLNIVTQFFGRSRKIQRSERFTILSSKCRATMIKTARYIAVVFGKGSTARSNAIRWLKEVRNDFLRS